VFGKNYFNDSLAISCRCRQGADGARLAGRRAEEEGKVCPIPLTSFDTPGQAKFSLCLWNGLYREGCFPPSLSYQDALLEATGERDEFVGRLEKIKKQRNKESPREGADPTPPDRVR
jgi:hypothetical protein